jgi:exopolysaccharide biosynthesis protein
VRKRSATFLVLFLVARFSSAAEWAVVSSTSERANAAGVEHLQVALADSTSGDRAKVELASFSAKTATLRVIDDPSASGSLAGVMQRENCIAGVNGGYFDPDHAPVGLLVSDGRVVSPLRKARLLSGVVRVINGRVQIQRPTEFSLKGRPSAARQCGPFLVDRGKPISGLNDTRPARRTFVVTGAGDRAAIGYSSAVTLAQLGDLLATPGLAGEWKIQRALNLDGGSSSGFWFAGENGIFSIREQKTVRDYLAVTGKP